MIPVLRIIYGYDKSLHSLTKVSNHNTKSFWPIDYEQQKIILSEKSTCAEFRDPCTSLDTNTSICIK